MIIVDLLVGSEGVEVADLFFSACVCERTSMPKFDLNRTAIPTRAYEFYGSNFERLGEAVEELNSNFTPLYILNSSFYEFKLAHYNLDLIFLYFFVIDYIAVNPLAFEASIIASDMVR